MKTILTIRFFLFLFLMIFLTNCHSSRKTIQQNKAVVRNYINAWTAHDVEKITALFTENGLFEEVGTGRKLSGREEIAAYAASTLSGVPDSKFIIVTLLADEESAMVEWVWKGTNSVGWPEMGIPATNKYFELKGVSVMKIKNKMIVRNSEYWDWSMFMKGIGLK